MEAKRPLFLDHDDDGVQSDHQARAVKRVRKDLPADEAPSPTSTCPAFSPSSTGLRVRHCPAGTSDRDIVSSLPNELLARIFSYLSESQLLRISPVSKRFNHIAADSQLWRIHYYRRFILPRAHRIPGFRSSTRRSDNKLYYNSQKSIWADGGFGRRGGLLSKPEFGSNQIDLADTVDWKREYRLQHNWSQGQCAVQEVQVHEKTREDSEILLPSPRVVEPGIAGAAQTPQPRTPSKHHMPSYGTRTMIKVVDGLAITVDWTWGLRAWDLRSRRLKAQLSLETQDGLDLQPTALAVDEQLLANGLLDLAVGFEDGSFGVWRFNTRTGRFSSLLRHDKPGSGKLMAVAYRYPYFFAATPKGFITLYSFGINPVEAFRTANDDDRSSTLSGVSSPASSTGHEPELEDVIEPHTELYAPQVLTSLKSQHTRQPLALSIRASASSIVASIAYSFDSWGGWCIGIQDFDIRASSGARPVVLTSRVAYTLPTTTRQSTTSPSSRPEQASPSLPGLDAPSEDVDDGPTRLSYSHPYLLATLPDNTLALHICTSTAETLHISDAVRLWGHTSGISDAEITPRGKAVSVSTRGDELRVWELEGRSAAGRIRGGSVEIRPRQHQHQHQQQQQQPQPRTPQKRKSADDVALANRNTPGADDGLSQSADDKRDWVGFDDEMVIVLKSTPTGKESLVIYDFT
ncbi:hypothetical protein NLU13_4558 [Sarocladium strictum]|uniref:F-box domain-containing protein n=1 Tax=Sarocladium strictum TaxID=5046 RepID=A0AA39GJ35_SARSR|nr:hypothetical protein NLU13_4558 [Sarocladium strictum]